jgi:hypothetical protein
MSCDIFSKKQTSNFEAQGYLSESLDYHRNGLRKKYQNFFEIALEANTQAHSLRKKCQIPNDDGRRLLSGALFARALNLYAGAVRMAELGMTHEAEVLLRSLVEVTIYLVSTKEDIDFVAKYEGHGLIENRKHLNAIKADLKLGETYPGFTEAKCDQGIQNIDAELKSIGISQQLKVATLATTYKMSGTYNTVYRMTSKATHCSSESIRSFFRFDKMGNIVALYLGPFEDDIPAVLQSGTACILFASKYFAEVNGEQAPFVDELFTKMKAL